jgi:hypothetical protein
VGTAGDVNGDGYADVIVGAPNWDGGQEGEGEVFVYLGADDGLETVPDWYLQKDVAHMAFGYSVGTAGDVNGDGYDDVIIGAPGYQTVPGDDGEGAAWVHPGSDSGVDSHPIWGRSILNDGARYGSSVGSVGDVNGDGYGDFAVGIPFWTEDGETVGKIAVYHGGDPYPSDYADWSLVGSQAGAEFGHAVGTAGDVNADGYSDLIVGAPEHVVGSTRQGRAWVYLGSRYGVQEPYVWRQRGSVLTARYGYAVGTAGDVNCDGYSDIIVGAPRWWDDPGEDQEGKVWVYHGSRSGVEWTSSWRKEGGQAGAYYGFSVGTAGDVNGDGCADVIIGAKLLNEGQTNEGGASLYLGSRSGLGSSRAWHGQGDQVSAHYGYSVGTAGDVNGDGYADIIVGAPFRQRSGDKVDEGQAYLYYGNGGRGAAVRPLQQQEDQGPVARLGLLDTHDFFVMGLLQKYPFGTGGGYLEVEVKRLGVLFDGSDTTRTSRYPYYGYGSEAWCGVIELTPDTPYHWRIRWHYYPDTTPWLPASRWMTMPWNGWNETDLRTSGGLGMLPLVLRGSS